LPGSCLNCNETRRGGGSSGSFFTDNVTTQQKLFCFVLLCFVGCGNILDIIILILLNQELKFPLPMGLSFYFVYLLGGH
jgi:hypothetical protein